MQTFEYKVVPAPKKGERARGVKRTEDRFANTLMAVMNDLGREGWEYLRADTLPCEERVGLTGKTTHFQNMLVFRRVIPAKAETVAETTPVPAPPSPTPTRSAGPLTKTAEQVTLSAKPADEPKVTLPRRVTVAEPVAPAVSADVPDTTSPNAATEARTGLAAE